MCVCMYVCRYVGMYVCTCVRTYVCMYVCMYVYMYAVRSMQYASLRLKFPLFFFNCDEISVSSTQFRKTLKYQMSFKSVRWEPSFSMRTDGLTDTTKLTLALRNFEKAP